LAFNFKHASCLVLAIEDDDEEDEEDAAECSFLICNLRCFLGAVLLDELLCALRFSSGFDFDCLVDFDCFACFISCFMRIAFAGFFLGW